MFWTISKERERGGYKTTIKKRDKMGKIERDRVKIIKSRRKFERNNQREKCRRESGWKWEKRKYWRKKSSCIKSEKKRVK